MGNDKVTSIRDMAKSLFCAEPFLGKSDNPRYQRGLFNRAAKLGRLNILQLANESRCVLKYILNGFTFLHATIGGHLDINKY